MKQSKIFHTLYLAVMALPLFLMGVFAIYSQNHEINDNTLQVQENLKVDFNQKTENDEIYLNNVDWARSNLNIGSFTNFHWLIVKINSDYTTTTDLYFGNNNGEIGAYVNNTNSLFNLSFGNNELRVRTTRYSNNGIFIFSRTAQGQVLNFTNIQAFDLTQMFGEGNEPTIAEFNALFPNSYYEYTESQEMIIENAYTTTYDDTDIMSQFMYVSYNALDKYLNFSKYQPFSAIYQWSQNTFFGGNAPMVFFIMFQMMCYWLVMSLFWLIFDVLLYVPSMIHKMIDKARLE